MKARLFSCFVAVVTVCVCASPSFAQSGWSRTYGGVLNDWGGTSVQQTPDGGYIEVGGTASFGVGGTDVYLIKTAANGNLQWSRTYGGDDDDYGLSVQQATDGGYIVVGWTTSFGVGHEDVYLIKTDANGNLQWSRTYGGSTWDIGFSVQQTADGGYIVAGITDSFGAGWDDVYLIKTDANGNLQWSHTYGGTSSDGGYSVQQTTDGGYVVAGRTSSFGAGGIDVYLIKTNAAGWIMWDRTYGGSMDDYGYSVQQTTDGGYIVAGWTSSFGAGMDDVYLVKTNPAGPALWSYAYGGSNSDFGYSVQQTADGGYIVGGDTRSFGVGGFDIMLTKLTSNGNTCIGQCVSSTELPVTPQITDPPTEEDVPFTQVTIPPTMVTSPPTQVTTVCVGLKFVRADVEEDGDHDIFDCLRIIYWLGGSAPEPSCVDAADVDDDGDVDIFDGLRCIYWIGGAANPPPPPCCAIPESCGLDPTPDDLGCGSYPPCDCYPQAVAKLTSVGLAEESRLAIEQAVATDRTVVVPVTLVNAEPLVAFSWTIEYNPELVSAKLVDNTGLVTEEFDVFASGVSEPGVVKVAAVNDMNVGDGVEKLPAGQHRVARIVLEVNKKALSRNVSLRVANSVMAIDHRRALNHEVEHGLVKATDGLPIKFQLDQNYPNPFNPITEIGYALPVDCRVKLEVYNIQGQRVAIVVDEHQEAGMKTARWDGRDERGGEVASGVYLCRLRAGAFQAVRRMLLLR